MTKTAKKKSVKKQRKEKGTTGIKYEDKSKGQPELVSIFEELKTYLMPYEKDFLTGKQSDGQYHLWSNKKLKLKDADETRYILPDCLFKKVMWAFIICLCMQTLH